MAQSTLDIILRTKKQGDAEKQTASGLSNLKSRFEEITGVSFGAAAAFGALVSATQFVIGAAADAERVEAQLNAVLKSTRYAAGLSADELQKLAARYSDLTAVEDETILKAEAVLLTFTKVGREVFPDATMAALNMSAALGTDLQGSIIQVGKALNDPIQGVTALRRVGVSFTQEQQEMIRTLVESGKTLEAQKLILEELETQFGGAAEAIGNTFTGQLERFKNSIGNAGEIIGGKVLPALNAGMEGVNNYLKAWQAAVEAHERGEASAWDVSTAMWRIVWTGYTAEDAIQDFAEAEEEAVEETGFLKNALEGAGQQLEEYSEEAEEAAKAQAKLREEMAMAAVQAGLAGDFTKIWDEYDQTIQGLQKEQAELTAELEKTRKAQELMVAGSILVKGALRGEVGPAYDAFRQQAAGLIETHKDLEKQIRLAKEEFGANSQQVQELTDKLAANERQMNVLAANSGLLKDQLDKLRSQGYEPTSDAVKELEQRLRENEAAQYAAAKAAEEAVRQLVFEKAAADLGAEATLELARSMGLLDEQSYRAAKATLDLRAEYDMLDGTLGNLDEQFQESGDLLRSYVKDVNALAAELNRIPRKINVEIAVATRREQDAMLAELKGGGIYANPGRQFGGPVWPDEPVRWQEPGNPEIAIFPRHGYILNQRQAQEALAGSQQAGNTYNFYLTANYERYRSELDLASDVRMLEQLYGRLG